MMHILLLLKSLEVSERFPITATQHPRACQMIDQSYWMKHDIQHFQAAKHTFLNMPRLGRRESDWVGPLGKHPSA